MGGAIGETGKPATWRLPMTELVVSQQRTRKPKTAKPIFWWKGKDRRPITPIAVTSELDQSRHARSLAPNVIHSLDAAHLMITLTVLTDRDDIAVSNLATVHDSFATSAIHAPALAGAFKWALALLYGGEDQPLASLAQQFAEQCEKLPPPPVQGTLRIGLSEPGFEQLLFDTEPLK